MTALERLMLGREFGFEAPLTIRDRPLETANPRTLRMVAHSVEDARGRKVVVIEKTAANRPVWSGTTPEALFYEYVLPRWPFMHAHVCALHAARHGPRATTILTSAVLSDRHPVRLFDDALALLPDMQATGAALLASGALSPAIRRQLDFYRRSAGRPSHRLSISRLCRSPLFADAIGGAERTLTANFDRLARRARAAPRAICHLDLLRENMFEGPAGPILIDWGEAAVAPAGFDYGSLFAAALRALPVSEAEAKLAAMWRVLRGRAPDGPSGEAIVLSAYYFMQLAIIRNLATRRTRPPRDREDLYLGLLADVAEAPRKSRHFLNRIAAF